MSHEANVRVERLHAREAIGPARAVALSSLAPNEPNSPRFGPRNEDRAKKQSQSKQMGAGRGLERRWVQRARRGCETKPIYGVWGLETRVAERNKANSAAAVRVWRAPGALTITAAYLKAQERTGTDHKRAAAPTSPRAIRTLVRQYRPYPALGTGRYSDLIYRRQGARIGRLSNRFRLSSPTSTSLTGSHWILRPVRMAMSLR